MVTKIPVIQLGLIKAKRLPPYTKLVGVSATYRLDVRLKHKLSLTPFQPSRILIGGTVSSKKRPSKRRHIQLAARRAGDAITRTISSVIIITRIIDRITMRTLADQVGTLRVTILDAILPLYSKHQ